MKWVEIEAGWYTYVGKNESVVAAVYNEGAPHHWCVYIKSDMPPGDSQHRTLREAKNEVECKFKATGK